MSRKDCRSDTPFIIIEGGIGGSTSNFAVSRPFSVTGTGGVIGVNGGILFDIPGTPLSFGPRVGWLGSNMSGDIAHPIASPTFTYTVDTRSTVYAEGMLQWPVATSFPPSSASQRNTYNMYDEYIKRHPIVFASFGFATTRTSVTGTSAAFAVTDSRSTTGITGSIGLQFPIASQPAVIAGLRYIGLGSETFNLPGPVAIERKSYIATAGLKYDFGPATPWSR